MGQTRVLMDEHLHEEMKKLAGNKKGQLIEEYREAVRKHIAEKTQENISRNSGLEEFVNERMDKMDRHLASMLARNGMDTSMALMGVVELLVRLLKVDRAEVITQLRKEGARYFSTAIKDDKDKSNEKAK